jgi:uncharacterized protein
MATTFPQGSGQWNEVGAKSMTLEVLKARSRKTLARMARQRGVSGWHSMTKPELVRALIRVVRASRAAATSKNGAASSRTEKRRTPARASNGSNGKAHGELLPPRSRDLCTIEIRDSNSSRRNYLDTSACDAHWMKAEWDLSRDSIRRAESRLAADWHGAIPVLRLLEVKTSDQNSGNETHVRDVVIEAGVNTWYVNVPADARTYRMQIGYRTAKGTFFSLAKSNCCSMPILNANVRAESEPQSNGHAAGAASGRGNGQKPSGRLARPLGFSSLAHFGPAASDERKKGDFSLKLDTEMIVHGSTSPGSVLAVHGEPVELRDDGSFTLRVHLPEGRQVIAFTAMSPRGSERRMVVLGMERNTKELERQYFDGGNAEGHE